jgi:hypothetical protein
MDINIDGYIELAKKQLYCNTTQEEKDVYYTYNFTNEQIDDNIPYFIKCLERDLSPYKALLFFHDFLNGDYGI